MFGVSLARCLILRPVVPRVGPFRAAGTVPALRKDRKCWSRPDILNLKFEILSSKSDLPRRCPLMSGSVLHFDFPVGEVGSANPDPDISNFKFEILNPKSETNMKYQIRMFKIQKRVLEHFSVLFRI